MKGGNAKVIPIYKQSNPSLLPNEQKEIFKERQSMTHKNEPEPTISFQYRQPPKPKQQNPTNGTYFPVFPQNIAYPPQFNYMYPGYPGQIQTYMPPIIKNIHINTDGGPTGYGQHERLFTVYEDALPNNTMIGTMTTLGERKDMYQFVRSSLFNNTDGNDISLSGKSSGDIPSLLSFIKFSDVNPFNAYKFSPNPYKGLPQGFLLYKSCYPIRYQEQSGFTQCANNSAHVNVRIYKLLEGSYLVNRLNPIIFYEYDEWRDISYYEYIRENIIKKKVCPHFVNLFGYFICKKSGIEFDKIDIMVDNKRQIKTEPLYKETTVDNTYEIDNYEDAKIISTTDTIIKMKNKHNQMIEINPKAYNGKTLVALTESPTYSITGWASKTYQSKGNINEMINRGTHSENEWVNVMFQLMTALYTMQIQKIYIKNFNLESNVFIKDVSLKGSVNTYWKYNIDNIEYYIQNFGYIVMIDSNYKDIDKSTEQTFSKVNSKEYKIYGKCFGSNCDMSDDEIQDGVFEMFKSAFDPNFFGQSFINTGGCKPPSEVLSLMSNIYTDAVNDTLKDIKPYFTKYMRKFMNNRIGTYLKEGEITNIRRNDIKDLKKGSIVVYEDAYGSYKFVLLSDMNNSTCDILTKHEQDDQDIIKETIHISSIMTYSKAEPIMQIFRSNETNFNDENLLETYVIK